jgi:fibronectin type 3 domain-containing protein
LGQQLPLDVFVGVKADSLFMFMNRTPAIGEGYHVEMRSPGEPTFTRMTDTVIQPILNPFSARAALGAYYYQITRELDIHSEQALLLKLRTDPFYGQVAMLSDRRAARVLGRFWAQGGFTGHRVEVRALLVDREGEVLEEVNRDVEMTERIPAPVTGFQAVQKRNAVRLTWDYPKWDGDHRDLAFRFVISRSRAGQPFVELDHKLLLRLEGMPPEYTDYTVEPGQTYRYRIVAVDAIGLSGDPREVAIQFRDRVSPGRPQGLVASADQGGVALSWTMSLDPDAKGYRVYRWIADQPDSVRLNDTLIPFTHPTFRDTTARLGLNYYYGVSCVDSTGNEGPHSNRASALLTDRQPPRPPARLHAVWSDDRVHLHWPPSKSGDVSGYRVRRGYDEHENFRLQEALITDTLYVDSGTPERELEPGRRYYYSVVTVDTMGYPGEPVGQWVLIPDTRPPEPAGRVVVTNPDGRELLIQWNPSLAADLAHYDVWRVSAADSHHVVQALPGDRSVSDRSVVPGDTIRYEVVAVDTAGNKSVPVRTDRIIFRDFTPPTAPAYVTAVETPKGVRIRWEPVGDFDLAGYHIYRSTLPTGAGTRVRQHLNTDLELVDAEGMAGLWYWIRAVDTSGNQGPPSNSVQAQKISKP